MFQKFKTLLACGICLPMVSLSTAGDSTAQQFGVPQSNARGGAVLGGVTGAIIGGIAGNQNDETPEGILIGGAVGALAGGLLGKAEDNRVVQQHQFQQQAQLAYQERLGHAVSIDDAIVLSQNGVGPNLIVNQILEHGVTHRLTVNDIIRLHNSGVNEGVITAMQEGRLATQVPVAGHVVTRPVPVVPVPNAVVVRPVPQIGLQFYSQPRYGYKPSYKYGHKPGYKHGYNSRPGYHSHHYRR